MRIGMNWKRIINWFTFNVCFAVLPLLFAWFFRALAGKSTLDVGNDFPEILFFSVMVCATTVGDIRGANQQQKWKIYFLILESILILGAICSAVLYGGLKFANVINPSMLFRARLLSYSVHWNLSSFSFLAV